MLISNRERFRAIAKSQRRGDLYIEDYPWPETVPAWIKQGAPPEILNTSFRGKFFGYSHSRVLGEIVSGIQFVQDSIAGMNLWGFIPPLVIQFQPTVLAEDGRHITVIDQGGRKAKLSKINPQNMPMYVEYPVKDRKTWEEFKTRLDPDAPGRWPADWDAYVKRINSRDVPVHLFTGSLFGYLREWMGLENLLFAFYDDPGLVEDMMDTMVEFMMRVVTRAVKDIKIDCGRFWEDMAYKGGPMISPDLFRKFMVPRYKKVTELLHKNDIDILFVDSDGNISELIPLWLECGINYFWPLEAAAGMNAVALKKQYGNEITLGGNIDKRAVVKGKDAIKAEVLAKVPFLLEKGGYFPSVDHMVPPDVTFDNYCYYINLMREVAGLEKLLV